MRTFEEIFEGLARHNDRSVIWNDFLNYAIDVNLLTLAKDKPEQKNYHGNEEAYWDMITAWITELTVKLEKYPYYDMLGQFYEELVQSHTKASNMGQFFTPTTVSELLNEISIKGTDKSFQGKVVNDPTCGSARMLLSAYVHSNHEAILYGQELDGTSARMAVLNFWSHGARGSILHMDTLEGTIFQGWRVNRYLHHGVPIPHIEEIKTEAEALDFIELIHNHPAEKSVDDEGIDKVVLKSKKTGQTTLM